MAPPPPRVTNRIDPPVCLDTTRPFSMVSPNPPTSPPVTHRRLALTLAAALLASTTIARAADIQPVAPPAPTPPLNSTGPSGSVPPAVLRETLPNGLRVVVVPDRLAPVVTTQITYLAGSNDAPPGFPGMAHATEHMMFRGSEGLDKDQLAELSALLGGDNNASTEETTTQYFFTVPAADLGLILHVEALRMEGANFAQADWDNERGAIEQEVSRDFSSPVYTMITQMLGTLFAGSVYEHDALGTRDSFDKTTAAMLKQFYQTWYAPNNAVLVIAGDVEPQAAMDEARRAFASVPRKDVPAHAPVTLGTAEAKTLTLPTNLPVGLAVIAFRAPGLTAPDSAATAILADIIASQRGPLFQLVPDGRALAAQFEYDAKAGVGLGLALGAFPAGGDPKALIDDIRRILQQTADGDIPPGLLEDAKRQKIAELAFSNDSIAGLAASWSRAVATRGVSSPDDIARAYAAVTLDDVRRVARTVLDPDHAVTAILTPRGDNAPVTQGGFGGGESLATPPDHPVTLPDWAAAALADVHLPDPGTPPDVSELPNGLRLIVVPEHVSKTVSVFGHIRNNPAIQEPPGKEGVAQLVDQLIDYGTEKRDRLALRAAIDAIAAQEGAGADFELKVLTPEFEPGMRLLAEHELQPAFPADAFPVLREQLARTLVGQLASPLHTFGIALRKATVPANDPSLREATPASVRAVNLADVRAFYAATYRPDLTTIVIVGDITPDRARQIVTETFGGWQAEGPKPDIDLKPIPASKPAGEHVADPTSLQDEVALSETVDLPVTSNDRYVMMLGNALLGGGFSSRLYRDLRINTGYVYSVSSSLSYSRTRARYTVSFGADQKNVEPARSLVIRDIQAMQTTPVGDAELTRAKAQLLRQLAMQRANVGAIAAAYLGRIELGVPLDADQRAAVQFQATTAEQLRDAFKKWLRPDDLAQIVRGP